MLVSGEVEFFKQGKKMGKFDPGQFIGEMLGSPNYVNTNFVVAMTDAVILRLNKDQFYELLSDNVKLADRIIEYI
jgi:ATP:ADP antiporter, AAA family